MDQPTGFAREKLRSFIERIERLEAEKVLISDGIREVYAEAKNDGFDVKTIRSVVRLRKQDTSERQEQIALIDIYLHALGMGSYTSDGMGDSE